MSKASELDLATRAARAVAGLGHTLRGRERAALAHLGLYVTQIVCPAEEVDTVGWGPQVVRVNPSFAASAPDDLLGRAILHAIIHVLAGHHGKLEGADEPQRRAACLAAEAIAEGFEAALTPVGAYAIDLGLERSSLSTLAGRMVPGDPVNELFKDEQLPCQRCEGRAATGSDGSATPGLDQGAVEQDLRSGLAGLEKGGPLDFILGTTPTSWSWHQVLDMAVARAAGGAGRGEASYARPSRRQLPGSPCIQPGYRSPQPRLAVLADVSGSMSVVLRDLHSAIVAVRQARPGLRVWLTTHTTRVCFQGWIDVEDQLVRRALGHRGGTDPAPAYRAMHAAGPFDLVVHFTDGEFDSWPESKFPLVIGLFGRASPAATPPATATVIHCQTTETF